LVAALQAVLLAEWLVQSVEDLPERLWVLLVVSWLVAVRVTWLAIC